MTVSMREMLEAGVHFGHQTRFWNPKMAPYIYGHRNKIHIINLEKTQPLFLDAMKFVRQLAARRGTILMIGTKRQAREVIAMEAQRAGMPYVDQRWLGGMRANPGDLSGIECQGGQDGQGRRHQGRLAGRHGKLQGALHPARTRRRRLG